LVVTGSIKVGENVTIDGDLSVGKNLKVDGDLTVNKNLKVNGSQNSPNSAIVYGSAISLQNGWDDGTTPGRGLNGEGQLLYTNNEYSGRGYNVYATKNSSNKINIYSNTAKWKVVGNP
jgi:hypothetical protein